jgi:hypothetical protein
MTPETNVATESLRTLHRIHRQLDDLRERLARGPRMIKARETNLQQAQKQLDEARARHHALKVATDEKQLQLGTAEAGIAKRKLQLQQATNNHEYQALKDQIAATAAANEVLEVEILEAMEKLDGLAQQLSRREAEVETAKKEILRIEKDIEVQRPLIEGDIQRLGQELSECEAALPETFREHYYRVVRGRGEDALAAVEGEYCSGCNQHVPVNMINELMLSHPVACRSCGRLLYLPEDAAD